MRIALVVHKFPPFSQGGTEIYTQSLARELSGQGHDVSVFYRRDTGPGSQGEVTWEKRKGYQACRVSKGATPAASSPLHKFLDTFINPSVEGAFGHFLDRVEPDVVHFQHVMGLSYRLIGVARRRGLPVVLTLHDYWFICANSQLIWPNAHLCRGKAWGLNCARCVLTARVGSPVMQLLRPVAAPLLQVRDRLIRQAALAADLLIAPSRFLIRQYIGTGFPASRFLYLENGIDVERIQRYPRRPSHDGGLRFTYLGSLAWQKGVHVLVEAFRGISPDTAHMRVYGDPTVFPEYAERLKAAASSANTSFEGSVPNEEVGRVLAETDVLVVPSLWYENSPVVIQEAFAAGVPVVGSRIGALREKVKHGENVLLCEAGNTKAFEDCIRSLADSPQRIAALQPGASTATAICQQAEAMTEVYRNLVCQKRY